MLGAICGDILGSPYEFEEIKYEDISKINMFLETNHITDDSVLTFAVADWLLNDIEKDYYNDEKLKESLAKRFVYWTRWSAVKEMAYGTNYMQWFFKAELIQEYEPINSYGNGSGMRVSPVGWFFDTMEETMRFAKLSADVTHNHPEGEKGAMCIAAAIFLARKGKTKKEVKDYLLRAFGYELLNKTVSELRESCTWSSICQDTVPMAVVAFLESEDYESTIRNALSYGSDSDTIADMAGAIAEAYYNNIPEHIKIFCLSKIPEDPKKLIEQFYCTKSGA